MSVYDLIETVRVRPGMYLGSNSVTALMHFINGYRFAELEAAAKSEEHAKPTLFPLDFWYFHEFTKVKLGFSSSVAGWRNLILETCGGDEKKALEMFFTLFDEFEQIRPVRYWKAVLSAENIAYNDGCRHCYRMTGADHSERKPIYDKPLAAYIIELDLTGKTAYLLVIETENGIKPEHWLYSSFEQAAKNKAIPESAETYFGKIGNWTELSAPPEFGKILQAESLGIQVQKF